MEQSPSAKLQFIVGDIGYAFNNDIGVSVARLTTVIKMYMYYDKRTCNKNMIRHLPYIHTRYTSVSGMLNVLSG
jgi:hypothetical protein